MTSLVTGMGDAGDADVQKSIASLILCRGFEKKPPPCNRRGGKFKERDLTGHVYVTQKTIRISVQKPR